MIFIETRRCEDDGLAVMAYGHAGYAPKGKDIVCAGVSALIYSYLAYLESLPAVTKAGARLNYWEADGATRIFSAGLGGEDVRGWRVIDAGLRELVAGYPDYVVYRNGYVPFQSNKEVKREQNE